MLQRLQWLYFSLFAALLNDARLVDTGRRIFLEVDNCNLRIVLVGYDDVFSQVYLLIPPEIQKGLKKRYG